MRGGFGIKNIIVSGPPRSGKSTFVKRVLKEFSNYNLIQDDIIRSAYFRAISLNEAKKLENKTENGISVHIDMGVLDYLTKEIYKYAVNYEPKLDFILDVLDMDFDDLKELESDNSIIIIFGYPDISPEEGLDNLIKYDTEEDWTYIESEYRIYTMFEEYIEVSKEYVDLCKKYDFKFVNVSYNRDKVMDDLMIWLKDELEK